MPERERAGAGRNVLDGKVSSPVGHGKIWVRQHEDERRLRIHIEPIRSDGHRELGPEERPRQGDSFDLFCDAETNLPVELRMAMANGVVRRVVLSEYQEVPGRGVLMPWNRKFLTEDGRLLMVEQVLRVQDSQRMAETNFRPGSR